jgi:predicted transglutaminase-like cysteine proteinase
MLQAAPVLAPLSAVKFCMTHAEQCRSSGEEPIEASEDLFRMLDGVNREVNDAISPQHGSAGDGFNDWSILPARGDCNDYAVSKRAMLLSKGLPSSALLLAVAQVQWGEWHLVLVVRTDRGDYVLDNLNSSIRPWSRTGYRWSKRQSVQDPQQWVAVAPRGVAPMVALASSSNRIEVRDTRPVTAVMGPEIATAFSAIDLRFSRF